VKPERQRNKVKEEFKPFSFAYKAGSSPNWKHVYTFIVLLHFTLPSTLIRKKERQK
jgi:hypothetical protein